MINTNYKLKDGHKVIGPLEFEKVHDDLKNMYEDTSDPVTPVIDDGKKYRVYLFSDANYKNIAFENFSGIKRWIENDLEHVPDEDLEHYEYTIKVTMLTRKEIEGLPDAD